MAGIDNLDPVRTKEEARERGRNGGVKSGESRRRKKNLRELTLMLLEAPELDMDAQARLEALGLEGTNGASMMLAMLEKAKNGSEDAARFVRDTSGQAPKQVQQVITGEGVTSDDLRGMSDEELRSMLDQADEAEDEA